jgi:hypothetical protein
VWDGAARLVTIAFAASILVEMNCREQSEREGIRKLRTLFFAGHPALDFLNK